MWSWVLHRITGVAIFFFLLVHILDTALLRVSQDAYNAVIGTYQTPIMGLGEIALVASLDGRQEVEIKLPGRYRLDGALRGALKSAPGVLMLEDA